MVCLLPVMPRRNRCNRSFDRHRYEWLRLWNGRALAEAAPGFKGCGRHLTLEEQKRNIAVLQRHAPAHFRNELSPEWFGAPTGMFVMTAALATLAFLIVLWVVNLVLV